MSKVNFCPWVGSDYARGGIFGKKIMILGESHYCEEKFATNNLTTEVINQYLHRDGEFERWMNTFIKFERSLLGKETSASDSKNIWNSVIFYNFLQVPMSDARVAGTRADYNDAEPAFFEVLDKYKPEYIIVWGARLWDNLPNKNWKNCENLVIDDKSNQNGEYTLSNGSKAKVIAVNHPSTGYSWDYWYEVIQAWMK